MMNDLFRIKHCREHGRIASAMAIIAAMLGKEDYASGKQRDSS